MDISHSDEVLILGGGGGRAELRLREDLNHDKAETLVLFKKNGKIYFEIS
jgi:hypothetical protein